MLRNIQTIFNLFKLAHKKMTYDNLSQMATTLTFYTLTAIVPFLAVALGVAKGFGLDKYLEEQLAIDIAGQKQIMQAVLSYSHNMLTNLRVEIVSGIGLLILFFLAFKVLSNIESSFNKIWQVSSKRHLGFKFTRYMALCLVAPLVLILNNAIRIYAYKYLGLVGISIGIATKVMTTTIICAFFVWLYTFMPNYSVKLKFAIISALIASIILQTLQALFLYFQLSITNYGGVYGGLAALPIFLIWLQITWIILLFGAELCFLLQHKVTHVWEFDISLLSWNKKLKILTDIKHLGAVSIYTIAQELKISTSCIQDFLNALVKARILYKVSGSGFDQLYIPSVNIDSPEIIKTFDTIPL
jgi:membrane protein